MKYEIIPESCRICLQKCKKSHSIYEVYEDEDEDTPLHIMQLLTGINFEDTTNTLVPQRICKNCELSLNLAHQLRKKILKSQRYIENYLRNQSYSDHLKIVPHNDATDEDETQTDEEELLNTTTQFTIKNELVDSPVDNIDENNVEYLDEVFLESEDQSSFKGTIHLKEFNNDTQSVEILNSTTEDFDDFVYEEALQVQKCVKRKGCRKISKVSRKKLKKCQLKKAYHAEHDDDSSGNDDDAGADAAAAPAAEDDIREFIKENAEEIKKEELLSRPSRGQGKSRVVDERGHICDICGNIYNQRGRMLEHRRRHNKELRYACE